MAVKKRAGPRQRRPRAGPRRAQKQERKAEAQPEAACEKGFLFDPYWDEVFAAYYDPTLRTCCTIR
ncbi:MAG: hypothetical protein QME71_10635 [Dehalococcoidia bacterium]|nr:hypothetical protein [Dehalococcoidia bacterium]